MLHSHCVFIFYCVEKCRNKKREFLKGETNEPEASSKMKNCKDMCSTSVNSRRVTSLINLAKDEKDMHVKYFE